MIRSMLKQKKLPHSFCEEAICTVIYVLNKLSTKKLKEKVSKDVWFGGKQTGNHLKKIGSLCLRHVLDTKREKLQNKRGYNPSRISF